MDLETVDIGRKTYTGGTIPRSELPVRTRKNLEVLEKMEGTFLRLQQLRSLYREEKLTHIS